MLQFLEEKWPELLIVAGLGAQLLAVLVPWL
jgi:hypothetical protein